MVFSKKVQVTNVSRAVENNTGNSIFLVQFGEELTVDEELRKYIAAPLNSKPAKKVFSNIIQVYFNFDDAVPYKVGSEWKIEIKNNGELSIKEI